LGNGGELQGRGVPRLEGDQCARFFPALWRAQCGNRLPHASAVTAAVTHDERIGRLEVRVEKVEATSGDLEGRLRELEKTVWKAAGALGLGMVLLEVGLK